MLVSADRDPRKAGTIWAVDLEEKLPVVTPEFCSRFTLIQQEQVKTLAAAMGPGSLPEIEKRFAAGRKCYADWMGGEIASYGWVSYDEEMVGELNLRIRLVPGEAYIWDCATLPPYRNRHLYSALLSQVLHELKTQKISRVWIGADLDNLPSQRGIARAGFHHVANMLVERFIALRMVWLQAAPDVPEPLVAEARRVYLGDRDNLWLEALEQVRKDQEILAK